MTNNRHFTLTLIAALAAVMLLAAGCAPDAENVPNITVTPEAVTPAVTEPPAEPTGEPADPYAEIIAQYADAVQAASGESPVYGEYVAVEWQANPQPVFYARLDMDGDGVEELFICGAGDGESRTYYDVFTLDSNKPARLFDMDFGYRVNFTPYVDGSIRVDWSNSAFESGSDIYKLSLGKVEHTAEFVTTVSADAPDAPVYTHDGEAVSEADYNAALSQYAISGEPAFDWQKVTD